jgi:hypothetical protein
MHFKSSTKLRVLLIFKVLLLLPRFWAIAYTAFLDCFVPRNDASHFSAFLILARDLSLVVAKLHLEQVQAPTSLLLKMTVFLDHSIFSYSASNKLKLTPRSLSFLAKSLKTAWSWAVWRYEKLVCSAVLDLSCTNSLTHML